jgi:hypothetical protein
MRILALRPEPPDGSILARLDAELTPHVRLYNLQLKRTASGALRVVAPNLRGQHSATFSAELSRDLADAAVAALSINGGHNAHVDRITA